MTEVKRPALSSAQLGSTSQFVTGLESDVTDLRQYAVTGPDIGAEDLQLSEDQFQGMLTAIGEFFDPARPSKTYFVIGKEKIKIPGNAVVMTANSGLIAGVANTFQKVYTILPDMPVSESPRALVSAWLYINAITPNEVAPWTWEFTLKDHAWLYFWLRALQVELTQMQYVAEWFVNFAYDWGDTYTETGYEPKFGLGQRVAQLGGMERVLSLTPAEFEERFPGTYPNLQNMSPAEFKAYITDQLFNKRELRRLRLKSGLESLSPLLGSIYDDLAPTCRQLIDSKFSPEFKKYELLCQAIDDIADLSGKPRFEFQQAAQQAPRETNYITGPLGDFRYETPAERELKKRKPVYEMKVETKITFKDGSTPDLTAYASFSPEQENAKVAQATLLALSPDYARERLFEFRVGRENIAVFSDPLDMSVFSATARRLLEKTTDTKEWPQLAAGLSVSDSPRAFVKMWLYITGVTANTDDPLTSGNFSFKEAMQLWDWLNYFDVDISLFAMKDYIEKLSLDAFLLKDKLKEDDKAKLSLIHSRISYVCRSGQMSPLCQFVEYLEKALGIQKTAIQQQSSPLLSSSALRASEMEAWAQESAGLPSLLSANRIM